MTATAETEARIAVIGIGNVLLGDDGFGPFVIELLRAGWTFPACVELIDAGTPALGLATYLHGRETVLLVDAVAATGSPGELRVYRGEDLCKLPPKPRVSPHDPAVQEALWIAELTGNGPGEVLLVGVIPESLTLGAGVGDTMREAASVAAGVVVCELARRGAAPLPRHGGRGPQAWWMRDQL